MTNEEIVAFLQQVAGSLSVAKDDVAADLAISYIEELEQKLASEPESLAVVEVVEGHFLFVKQDGVTVFERYTPGRYTMHQSPKILPPWRKPDA